MCTAVALYGTLVSNMAELRMEKMTPTEGDRVRGTYWHAMHVESLAPPARKLAELGLTMFREASAGVMRPHLYDAPLLETVPGGVVRPNSLVAELRQYFVPIKKTKIRQQWAVGLATLTFATGASAIISHPDTRISGSGQEGEARLIVPTENRADAEEHLRLTGRPVALEDGLPKHVAVQWDNRDAADGLTRLSMVVHQEPRVADMAGDLSGISAENVSDSGIQLVISSFNTAGDFQGQRSRLFPEELVNIGNAALVAAYMPPAAR